MALCVFDIFPDGRAEVPRDNGLTGPGVYRWWHYDLSDPDLAEWAGKTLDDIPTAALLQAETRPRCDVYENGLILNLRGINMNTGEPAEQMVSVRMWVTRDVVVTVRVRRVFALDDIRQEMLHGVAPPDVASFLENLIGRLTARVQDEVLQVAEQTDTCEDQIADDLSAAPAALGDLRRSVIKLRRYLDPQRSALQKLAATDLDFMTAAQRLDLRELGNRAILAVEELDALRDRLLTLQDHYDSKLALRQGRNGYALSLVAAVFLPLGFLTGLFGVNVGGMPGLESPWAFALLSLGMIVAGGLMLAYLRWMKWL